MLLRHVWVPLVGSNGSIRNGIPNSTTSTRKKVSVLSLAACMIDNCSCYRTYYVGLVDGIIATVVTLILSITISVGRSVTCSNFADALHSAA